MNITLKSGSFHAFKAPNGAYLPIWEKEPGVFATVEGKDPTEFLRGALKTFDSYLQNRRLTAKKAQALKTLLDLSIDGVNLEVPEDGDFEEGNFANRVKEIETHISKFETDLKEAEVAREELCDFIIMCGVSPTENDTSVDQTASILKKLTGGTKPEGE